MFLFFIFGSQVTFAHTYVFPTKTELTESQNIMQPDAVKSWVLFLAFFADVAGVSGDFEILE